jgi:hypothetical protein
VSKLLSSDTAFLLRRLFDSPTRTRFITLSDMLPLRFSAARSIAALRDQAVRTITPPCFPSGRAAASALVKSLRLVLETVPDKGGKTSTPAGTSGGASIATTAKIKRVLRVSSSATIGLMNGKDIR